MGRRRTQEPNGLETLFAVLSIAPVWLGPVLAAVFFVGMRWVIPWMFSAEPDPENHVGKVFWPMFVGLSRMLAPLAAFTVLAMWILAEVQKLWNRKRLDRQTGIDSIRTLDWQEFELLLSEAFRRQGYAVEHCGRAGPDGGIDQRLTRAGDVTLVQCKHWRTEKVGVKVVREFLGVMVSEHADAGILVTSGEFTADAIAFAQQNGMSLVAGADLERMIRDVQRAPVVQGRQAVPSPPVAVRSSTDPTCPQCGSGMRLRTAKRGPNLGSQFWGCTRYPGCRGTRDQTSTSA